MLIIWVKAINKRKNVLCLCSPGDVRLKAGGEGGDGGGGHHGERADGNQDKEQLFESMEEDHPGDRW